MLSESIKAVYASVFFKESKAYMAATKNLIDQEKMAVVLQELVGSTHGAHFYPTISGVARSLNFYPIGSEKTEDGVVNLALGLGKYIVDGGVTLRFSPACPKQILQMSSVEMALKETQKHFYALDVDKIAANFSIDDAFNLAKLTLKDADKEGELRFVASTFDVDDHLIRDGYYPGGRKIVSFANILQHELFPLSEALRKVLQIGQQEMGRPVEIEFAVNIEDKENAKFFLLQIRPIVDNKLSVNASISLVDKTSVILYCNSALGHGVNQELHDVVYVRTETFNASNNKQIAAEIEQVNQSFVQDGKEYVLIGPGRWGSSDPWLGIPVKWPFISQAQMVVELGLENYRVEPSQGTHFFQNLTSFGVGYFTVNPYLNSGDIFDLEFLNSQKAVYESDFLRHVRFRFPLTVKIDGRKSIGVIEKPKFM
jgi:hypothetical protein